MTRYDQCDETCTVDCGHCKGAGRPVVSPVQGEAVETEQRSYPSGSIGAMFPEAARLMEGLLAERNALELKLAAALAEAHRPVAGSPVHPDETRLRELIAAQPYLGDWDEWAPTAYNRIPVMARAVMSHVYGRHDDTELPYAHCVLCSPFRVEARPGGSPVHEGEEAPTLAWMQRTQPWTAPYSDEFEASKAGSIELEPEQHRSLMHDLMHVTKAVGILASIAEWADHGSIRTERVDQAEYEGRIADLVMCALHMANNPPDGYGLFELQRAVIERVERVNGVKWASS